MRMECKESDVGDGTKHSQHVLYISPALLEEHSSHSPSSFYLSINKTLVRPPSSTRDGVRDGDRVERGRVSSLVK